MESKMDADRAKDLAAMIAAIPCWDAEAFMGLWPSTDEPGKYSGGWVVAVTRDGDDQGYILQGADEWPRLLDHLTTTPDDSVVYPPETLIWDGETAPGGGYFLGTDIDGRSPEEQYQIEEGGSLEDE